jgi:hypothetical protein
MAISHQKDEIKATVLEAFENVLDQMDSYGRRLSRWEEDGLVRVLALMTCGRFLDAAFDLSKLVEGTVAVVDAGREMSRPPRSFALTTKRLRAGLANLRCLD